MVRRGMAPRHDAGVATGSGQRLGTWGGQKPPLGRRWHPLIALATVLVLGVLACAPLPSGGGGVSGMRGGLMLGARWCGAYIGVAFVWR